MNRCFASFTAGLWLVFSSPLACAQNVLPVGPAINHPLVVTNPVRTAASWKKGVEGFGETLVSGTLALRGYEVLNPKIAGNRGIDMVAIKRNSAGTVTDVRLVEVKTHYGTGLPHLGHTRHGLQTSRTWFANRLWALRSRGEDGRALALEISRFRKEKGVPIEQLGEVYDINLRRMTYSIRNPVTLVERAGPWSIPRQLNAIAKRTPVARRWAAAHLAQSDQIHQARMGTWLAGNRSDRAIEGVTVARSLSLDEKQALSRVGRALARTAGRLALVAAIALDANEIYGHFRDYHAGIVSRQEFVVALARSGAGIAGAWAGATGGAVVGAWVGAFGGPFSWVTVPACGILGGAGGGVAGYWSGSYVGDAAAQAWCRSLDQKVKDRVDQWLKLTSTPFETTR